MATLIKYASKSIGALNAATDVVDISDADYCTFDVTGTWSGTITFFISNDGISFYVWSVHSVGQTSSTTNTNTTTTNGIFVSPVFGANWARAQMTSYTSGAATVGITTTRTAK